MSIFAYPIEQFVLTEEEIKELKSDKILQLWATDNGTIKIKTFKKEYTVGQLSMMVNAKEEVLNPNQIVSFENSSTVEVSCETISIAGEERKVVKFNAIIPGLLDNGVNWYDRFTSLTRSI